MFPSYDLATIAARLAASTAKTGAVTEEHKAAVAAILRAPSHGDDAEILLIRRAERDGDPWSGHMAFPGGRREPTDPSLLDTALRETREEVGLDLTQHAELLARLPDVPAVARGRRIGMIIAPFVFALRDTAPLELTLSAEVAEVLWAPLGPLARGERAAAFSYQHEGNHYSMPGFQVGERIVWGLTYRMLELLFGALHRA
jgi:8-oxo-dGTP pyrophosphatase MutT (NUDIX family)